MNFHTSKQSVWVKTAAMCLMLAFVSVSVSAQQAKKQQRYEPTWEALKRYEVPEWYKDAKFGIFIHWGVFSVPAFGSEWYSREMYQQGTKEFAHHVKKYGTQDKFGYKDFIPMFKAERYDPASWAKLFKEAGAKYIVPVAEHHDGFALYDSKLTKWDAVEMGPKRDLIGDLAAAVRKEGLVFGLSSHRAEHYFFFDGGMTFDSDVRDPKYADFYGPAKPKFKEIPREFEAEFGPDDAYMRDWLARCQELVDKYQPQLVYFDWWIGNEKFEPYRKQFAAHYYNRAQEWNRGVVINYKFKAFPEGVAVHDIERGQSANIRPDFWQTDTAVAKNSWGFTEGQDYKEVDSIIDDLVDIVSKNGTLLLNVGPRADGTIPEPEQKMLRDIGGWLKVNGEAIYGTRPWKIYGEGPTTIVEGSFNDTKRKPFTGQDVRFTTKGNNLYALALAYPGDELRIKSLGTSSSVALKAIKSVELLGSKAKVKWSQTPEGLNIQMPKIEPGGYAYALRIKL